VTKASVTNAPYLDEKDCALNFCNLKVCGLWDSTSVDLGFGYETVKQYLVFRRNVGLVDISAEDSLRI
jgi:hypothetical protein